MTVSIRDGKFPSTKTLSAEFTVETDLELISKANLGMTRQTCRLCGASGDFQTWLAREMFVGLRDEFRYFECPECQTMQIEKFPEDMRKYYAHYYYSFRKPDIKPPRPGAARDGRKFLDVGCGSGAWLCSMAEKGCVNLYGCDPFIEHDLEYENGVKIKKCPIHDMDGEFDFINMSHSFEHMPDPHEVFKTLGRLLRREDGRNAFVPVIQIEIPIFPNAVFDIFGPYWHQVDAPRHFFIYSGKSIRMLAEMHGFSVYEVTYLDDPDQYLIAMLYQLGVPYIDIDNRLQTDPALKDFRFDKKMFERLTECTRAANYGNYATFTLVRPR